MKDIDRGEVGFWFVLIVIALLCALCASCATTYGPVPPLCTTPCGINVYGPLPDPLPEDQGQPRWSCAEIERTERISLDAFRAVPDLEDACASFRGYALRIQPVAVWERPEYATLTNPGGHVAGLTYCNYGAIYVGNTSPLRSALPHELVHVAQRCWPPNHSNWGDAGINDALARVEAVGDADRARCFDAGAYVGPVDGGVCQ